MLISSILSPIVPGAGSGTSEPDNTTGGNGNSAGADTGGTDTGVTGSTGNTSGTGGSGTRGASGASGSAGIGNAHSQQGGKSGEVVRRADDEAVTDINLSRAHAERTQKMLLQASLIDGIVRASESDASMALFERDMPVSEPTEQISARYDEF